MLLLYPSLHFFMLKKESADDLYDSKSIKVSTKMVLKY